MHKKCKHLHKKWVITSNMKLRQLANAYLYLLMMKRFIEPLLHILFWGLLFYTTYSIFGVRVKVFKVDNAVISTKEFAQFFLVVTTVLMGFKILLFYSSTYYFLPKYLNANPKKKSILELALFFIVTLSVSLVINYLLIQNFYNSEVKKAYDLMAYSVVMHFLILFITIAYRISKKWIEDQWVISQLKQEKLQAELDLLKEQVNPHFLFNTLNNLYSEARKHTDKTVASGIAKLSHIMRYMIYDSNVEFVDLEKEIQYLESYIELQKLRIADDDPFEFSFHKNHTDLSIQVAPILFIPFVENAFKYGIHLSEKSFIHISLQSDQKTILFHITNSKFGTSPLNKHSGVGFRNVKRRLDLLYPKRHELKIEETDQLFRVELTLNLSSL